MASTVEVKVVLKNAKAVNAFVDGCNKVFEAAEDMPWNEGLQEAAELLRSAAKGLVSKNVT